ncbi:MAG: 2Fe-2S iron-sulfur cluster-binding protein [Acidiferrobacter sp.]
MSHVFYLDGHEVGFTPGQNVLAALLAAGIDTVPYFCFHPALGSLGACRQCAVRLYPHDGKHPPRLTMACLLPASDNLQVGLAQNDCHQEHREIIELLMTNHPLDCPVCDEGGSCHLQNMTVLTGHSQRRYHGPKRTYNNQDLGPLVWQEMNRCITCYRCVRFYQDYALGEDFGVFGSRNRVVFGRLADGPLQSPFSGNLVEICPTGALTDKVFRRHYARVWDLARGPSVCPHCAMGCNTEPGAREGTLRRIHARFHAEINQWFLCDRGRYGFRYTTAGDRPLTPRLPGRGADVAAAVAAVAERLQAGTTGFLGSPREDLDSNLALRALADALAAPHAVFASPWAEARARQCLALPPPPSLIEIQQADCIVMIGDVAAVAPMADLAVRQAVRRGAIVIVIASQRGAGVPADYRPTRPSAVPTGLTALADDPRLSHATRPILLGVAATLGPAGIAALRAVLSRVPRARVAIFDSAPNLWGAAYFAADGHAQRLQEGVRSGAIDSLFGLSADPLGHDWGSADWRALRPALRHVTVMDMINTDTGTAADIFLPTAAFPERRGVFINYEGRVQAFAPVYQRTAWTAHPAAVTDGDPEAAGGYAQPLGPPSPLHWLTRIAQAMGVETVWRERYAFYRQYLCPHEPSPTGPGYRLDEAQRLPFRHPAPPSDAAQTRASADWEADLGSWYGDEVLAARAPELQSLAPPRGLLVGPGVNARRATVSGPGGTCTLPVMVRADIVAGVVVVDRPTLAWLGVYPGEPLAVVWEDPV